MSDTRNAVRALKARMRSTSAPAQDGKDELPAEGAPGRAGAEVVLERVSKSYGDQEAVRDLNLSIAAGEFVSLLGPSGCGKSTTLRLIAGLEAPSDGEVRVAGKEPRLQRPIERATRLVFQSYALFPHLTVADNIRFGLQVRKASRATADAAIAQAIALVGLRGRERSFPSQLSGGEQQRVALCRALVTRPRVLLLDEPFAALDARVAKTMVEELKRLQRRVGITFVVVTHDQEQALSLGDRVAVMNEGHLVQFDKPDTVYRRPCNGFVAHFIGESNLFSGRVERDTDEGALVRIPALNTAIRVDERHREGVYVEIMVRPEWIALRSTPRADEEAVAGVCSEVTFRGSRELAVIQTETGAAIVADVGASGCRPGDDVTCCWKRADAIVVEARDSATPPVGEPPLRSVSMEAPRF